jgi:hypothetical protein
VFEQRFDLRGGQVGDGVQVRRGSSTKQLGGGVAMDEFEDPALGDVLDQQGQFRETQREEVMELVDEPGALADHSLEPTGDLTQDAQRRRDGRGGGGPLGQGEACGGASLDGVGLLRAEQGGAVVLVALRVATGEGDVGVGDGASGLAGSAIQLRQEVEEIIGVLSGGIEAADEGDGGVSSGDGSEALAELFVALGGLGEGELVGGG